MLRVEDGSRFHRAGTAVENDLLQKFDGAYGWCRSGAVLECSDRRYPATTVYRACMQTTVQWHRWLAGRSRQKGSTIWLCVAGIRWMNSVTYLTMSLRNSARPPTSSLSTTASNEGKVPAVRHLRASSMIANRCPTNCDRLTGGIWSAARWNAWTVSHDPSCLGWPLTGSLTHCHFADRTVHLEWKCARPQDGRKN